MNKRFELTIAELNSASPSLAHMASTSSTVFSGNTAPSGTVSTWTPSFCFRRLFSSLVWTLWVSFTSSRSLNNGMNICCSIPELLVRLEEGWLCLGVWVSLWLLGLSVWDKEKWLRLGVSLGLWIRGEVCLPIVVERLRAAVDLCLSRLGNPMGLGVLLGLRVPTHHLTFKEVNFSLYY